MSNRLEEKVLELVDQGVDDKEIARRLAISTARIERIRRRREKRK